MNTIIDKLRAFHKSLRFIALSGAGWLIDMTVYSFMTYVIGFNVAYGNFISAIPAITLVFCVSTKKIFNTNKSGLSLKTKYLIYFAYQMVLVSLVSMFGQLLYNIIAASFLGEITFIATWLKLICKIIITPITMITNYFVMKVLSEKF
ncbi:MAG: hypothetical protein R3Y58_11685 [Eubacteriales bacterium]